MWKKIISSILILAFINFLYGCYSQEKALTEELVANEEKIMQVVFPDGNAIEFDERGGTYTVIESGIEGKSTKGEKIILPFENIKELRLTDLPPVALNEIGDRKVTEVISNSDLLYTFNLAGGTYDKEQDKIVGVSADGLIISFKTNQIKEIHLEIPKTITKNEFIENEDQLISSDST